MEPARMGASEICGGQASLQRSGSRSSLERSIRQALHPPRRRQYHSALARRGSWYHFGQCSMTERTKAEIQTAANVSTIVCLLAQHELMMYPGGISNDHFIEKAQCRASKPHPVTTK